VEQNTNFIVIYHCCN